MWSVCTYSRRVQHYKVKGCTRRFKNKMQFKRKYEQCLLFDIECQISLVLFRKCARYVRKEVIKVNLKCAD
jgi:hypothetical protein